MKSTARTKTTFFFFSFVLSGLTADAGEVHLRAQAEVPGSIVLLGDVAEVRADDPKLAADLKRLELFPSPRPGRSRSLHKQELKELLALSGRDETLVKVAGARVARVVSKPNPIVLPKQPVPTEHIVPHVVVATRPLERGDTIRALDVKLQPLDGSVRGLRPFEQPEDAVGLEVTRPVASGRPLDRRHLQRPILVRRGELVAVVSQAPGVQVRTTARALENAGLDDLVTLESPTNRQRYTARVTGVQKTTVYASGFPVPADQPAGAPVAPITPKGADRR
jgi:flagella basal body P-ring formation protein FlgA